MGDYKALLEGLKKGAPSQRQKIRFTDKVKVDVYPRSITKIGEDYFFVGVSEEEKCLWILFGGDKSSQFMDFDGEILAEILDKENIFLKKCSISHSNAVTIRNFFPFTRPKVLGLGNAIGLGDRLGLAGPGHIRAVVGTGIKPVLAQQSIRELKRTHRSPEEVMNAATWAVFQEGYMEGFGADADHLKTSEDIDLMVQAGYTMYTIDPGDHVDNQADSYSSRELMARVEKIPWSTLEDTSDDCLRRYDDRDFVLDDEFVIHPDREEIYRAMAKYGKAIAHTYKMYKYLVERSSGSPFELEVSVDETDSVTTAFEHLFFVGELIRLGIKFVSLAPRFIGDFEKGVDYRGDLDRFAEEYKKHVLIAQQWGPYKISLHSGSDKFSVYEIIGKLKQGYVHVKTAGTSYLVALYTICSKEPDLFREIFDFSRERYPLDKASYHVSAKVDDVPLSSECSNDQLLALFEQDDARQVLHVAFGSVLTAKDTKGNYLFRDQIKECLVANEEDHYENLSKHLRKHIIPFL